MIQAHVDPTTSRLIPKLLAKKKEKQTTNEVTKTMVRVTAIAVVAPTQQLGANQYTSGEWVGGCRGLAAPGSSGGTAVQ